MASCRFFTGQAGSCRNGENCPFLHDANASASTTNIPSFGYQRSRAAPLFDSSKYKYVNPSLQKRNSRESDEEPPASLPLSPTPSTQRTASVAKDEMLEERKKVGYTELSALSSAELEAFQAVDFQPGKVPLLPPPLELIS